MDLVIQKIINSFIQIMLFALVPFIWWVITARKDCNFLEWIGLKRLKNAKENRIFVWVVGSILLSCCLSIFMLIVVKGVETATSDFEGMRVAALPAVLVYAIFNTSLPEEVLFRGFLLKRFSNKLGFVIGNTVQSVLFGLMHGALFFTVTGAFKAVLIIAFTGIIGWVIGYVNEKKADGWIIPGWCIHAAGNFFSGICSAFTLLG